jgi:uncharacterized protein YkwD
MENSRGFIVLKTSLSIVGRWSSCSVQLTTFFSILGLLVMALAVVGAPGRISAMAGELDVLRAHALELVNKARDRHSLAPLDLEDATNQAAQSHAQDMRQRSYYGHVSPQGNTVQDRYLAAGGSRSRLVAENIARCSGCTQRPDRQAVEQLHRGWMDSPEHRQNILSRGIAKFGFGIAVDPEEGLYAVQTFAGPGLPRGLQAGEEPVPLSSKQLAEAALRRINNAREAAGLARMTINPVLLDLARSNLPKAGSPEFRLEPPARLFEQMSADRGPQWRSLSTLTAQCSGCGVEHTRSDVEFFVRQWLDYQRYREHLLSRDATDLGFAIFADNLGKKIAIALVGASS